MANVLVQNVSMSNAEYLARIKVFGGSNNTMSISGGGSGYVSNITWVDCQAHSEWPFLAR